MTNLNPKATLVDPPKDHIEQQQTESTMQKRQYNTTFSDGRPQHSSKRLKQAPNTYAGLPSSSQNVSDGQFDNWWNGMLNRGTQPTREESLQRLSLDDQANRLMAPSSIPCSAPWPDQELPISPSTVSPSVAASDEFPTSPAMTTFDQQAYAPPPSMDFDPDHELEFELNTAMGMVWRSPPPQDATTPQPQPQYEGDATFPPETFPTFDFPLYNGQTASIPSNEPLLDDTAMLPPAPPTEQGSGFNQALRNLSSLESNLQAATKKQIDNVYNSDRGGMIS